MKIKLIQKMRIQHFSQCIKQIAQSNEEEGKKVQSIYFAILGLISLINQQFSKIKKLDQVVFQLFKNHQFFQQFKQFIKQNGKLPQLFKICYFQQIRLEADRNSLDHKILKQNKIVKTKLYTRNKLKKHLKKDIPKIPQLDLVETCYLPKFRLPENEVNSKRQQLLKRKVFKYLKQKNNQPKMQRELTQYK